MIELTRLNGSRLVVNSDLIQYAESAPDTTLTLLNGEKVVVRESLARVIELTVGYRARALGEAAKHSPGALVFASGATMRSGAIEGSGESREEIESGFNYLARRRTIDG